MGVWRDIRRKCNIYWLAAFVLAFGAVTIPYIPGVPELAKSAATIIKEGIAFFVILYFILTIQTIGRKLVRVSYCDTEEEVYESAIRMTEGAKKVNVVGPLQSIQVLYTTKGVEPNILKYRKQYVDLVERKICDGISYARIINFIPNWEDRENVELLAQNADFFAELMRKINPASKGKTRNHGVGLEILHCGNLPNISGDFHFNTSDKKTLIILGDSKKNLTHAVSISDKIAAYTFMGYFDDIIRSQSKSLNAEALSELAKHLRDGKRKLVASLLAPTS